jgi:D-glycero-alpha-D-manno-heptose 1-phosphate guanylyltransferase
LKNVDRYGTVEIDNNYKIIGFQEKEHKDQGYINGGIYIFNENVFKKTELPEKFSIEKDFFQRHATMLNFYGYISDGYFLDIGIPEDFNRAQHEFKRFTY